MATKNSEDEGQGRAALEIRAMLTELFTTAMSGDVRRVDALLNKEKQKHPDMSIAEIISHTKDGNDRTAVHFAGHGAKLEMLNYLLDLAPDAVDWEDKQGDTPLTLVVSGGPGRLPVVELLLQRGAKVEQGRHAKALHHAAAHEDVEVLRRLLEKGANVMAASDTGTALHWAAGHGAQQCVQVLIGAGAEVDAKDENGLTPLVMAAARGCGKCVAILARAGADVGAILSGNVTVLHMMADYGATEAVAAILEREEGRKCALLESDNGKPVYLAAWGDHQDVVELLLPYSEVKETVEELMEWGKAKRAQEEEAAAAAEASHAPTVSATPPDAPHLPPAPASEDDVNAALVLKEDANRAFVAKEFERALQLYTQAIALNGRDAVFWSNRSGCHMELGKCEEALRDGEMAKALKPDWSKARYRCAVAQLELKRYEDAALSAHEGMRLEEGVNTALHKVFQKAIELGRKEHQEKLMGEAKDGENVRA